MFGKLGREPNVVYPRIPMPFEPSEQATALIEVALLSYAGSYESMTPAARLQVKAREKRTLRGLKCIAIEDALPGPFLTSSAQLVLVRENRRELYVPKPDSNRVGIFADSGRFSLAGFTKTAFRKHRRMPFSLR